MCRFGSILFNRVTMDVQSLTQVNKDKHQQQEGCGKLSYLYGSDLIQRGECSTTSYKCNIVA